MWGSLPLSAGPEALVSICALVAYMHACMPQAEDPALQAKARSLLPLAEWRQQILEELALLHDVDSSPEASSLGKDELLAQRLVKWFKGTFFKWVSGCRKAAHAGVVQAGEGVTLHPTRFFAACCRPACNAPMLHE